MELKTKGFYDSIKSLGIVFGDIGTSPIYTLTVIFLTLNKTVDNIMGVLSLMVWTLVIVVTLEYTWLAMSLSRSGEGGIIVLKENLLPLLKKSRHISFFTFLSYIGISLLVGDGVITPAISIMSAVEGMVLIPGMQNMPQWLLIVIACLITIALFSIQKRGAGKIAKAFGPIMLIWFLSLAVFGILSISLSPFVLKAINPYYAVKFFINNGFLAFFVLSEVILCATGGEALFADMGHIGGTPIRKAWVFVFIALVLNYMGQGAHMINHPEDTNILFALFYKYTGPLYIVFLVLSIIATIIASQALISGMFSIVYQGINTRIIPMLKVAYTSSELRSQVYIKSVNWFLLFSVLLMIFVFKESSKLASAYGLAVSGDMMLTSIFMLMIFLKKNNYVKAVAVTGILSVNVAFLLSNVNKIPHGGYWSLIIASLPLFLVLLYTKGQRALYRAMHPVLLTDFLEKYNDLYSSINKIQGTSLYFAMVGERVSPYIVNTMFVNNIIYQENIFVTIKKNDRPYGIDYSYKSDLAPGLRVFEINMGYMEFIEIEQILKSAGIESKAIFYGIEHIDTSNPVWKLFSTIKKLVPSFDEYYKLPPNKLHGVITHVNM